MPSKSEAVLIAGGYGVVGEQIAACLRRRYPELPLVLAGRSRSRGEAVAARLGHATATVMDVTRPHPLGEPIPRAVIGAVNDPGDHLLKDAIRLGVPIVDITRWTARVRASARAVAGLAPRSPVLLASGWMAGLASVAAVAASRPLQRVESIAVSVLYALQDRAGPNSAAYMDRLATPFEVMQAGTRQTVLPFTDPRRITFPDGQVARVYRFDTPDQLLLPRSTGAASVAARIGFDSAATTRILALLVRSGLWKRISGERFTDLRRALLFHPGPGASHQIVIDADGLDPSGEARSVRATLSDPLGQTHLTAVGALVQLERLLGLDGAAPSPPGLAYPDSAPQIQAARRTLERFGVSMTLA
ncbi:hypothetical protein [Vulcanococcus limneticus]|uniref:hypothetical protein n=1 Tax=Vulcanococcus limneticus TaxID=2170428 RepID=UPI00398C01C2